MIKRIIKKVENVANINSIDDAKKILTKFKPSKIKFISKGEEGKVYYFIVKNSKHLQDGKYILKIFKMQKLKNNRKSNLIKDLCSINYLKNLSKLNLIPKIYFINRNYIIMEYVNAKSLSNITNNIFKIKKLDKKFLSEILNKIENELKIWWKLNLAHGDLHEDNILVSNKRVYLIDPLCIKIKSYKFRSDLDKKFLKRFKERYKL